MIPNTPSRAFVGFFAGSEGTTFLFDMLARHAGVLVPVSEPLERHQPYMDGVPLEAKMQWLRLALSLPGDIADRAAWMAALQAVIPAMPLDAQSPRLETATCVAFKVRPPVLDFDRDLTGMARWRAWGWRRSPRARFLAMLRRSGATLVVFERHNVVKRAVSSWRMLNERKSQFIRRNDGPSEIPPQDFLEELRRYDDYLALARAICAQARALGVRVETVVYESLLRDPQGVIARVLEALGLEVPSELPAWIRQSRYQKFTPTDLSRVLTNFEALRASVRGTPYETMLLDAEN